MMEAVEEEENRAKDEEGQVLLLLLLLLGEEAKVGLHVVLLVPLAGAGEKRESMSMSMVMICGMAGAIFSWFGSWWLVVGCLVVLWRCGLFAIDMI